jgi:hypothetical protein
MSESMISFKELLELAKMKKDNPQEYEELMSLVKDIYKDFLVILEDMMKDLTAEG